MADGNDESGSPGGVEPLPTTEAEAVALLAKRVRTVSKDLHLTRGFVDQLEERHEKRIDTLQTSINTLAVEQKTTGERVDALAATVDATRLAIAESKGVLELIYNDVAATKRIAEHREKIAAEIDAAEKKAAVDVATVERKTKIEIGGKLGAAVITVATALVGTIAVLAQRGC